MVRYGTHKDATSPRNEGAYQSFITHQAVVLPHSFLARIDDLIYIPFAATQVYYEETPGRSDDSDINRPPKLVLTGLMKQTDGSPGFLFAIPHVDPYRCVFVTMGWCLFWYVPTTQHTAPLLAWELIFLPASLTWCGVRGLLLVRCILLPFVQHVLPAQVHGARLVGRRRLEESAHLARPREGQGPR